MNQLYVQYGCGWSAPAGWRNFDASPTLQFERFPFIGQLYKKNDNRFPDSVEYGDIVKNLPIIGESCAGVYCSHILEHLAYNDLQQALIETYRILKPGGIFRMFLPDLEYEARIYIDNKSPTAARDFLLATSLGKTNHKRGLIGLILDYYGNSPHLSMWDYQGLAQELGIAGFVSIQRAKFGDSTNNKFADVENAERWVNALGIEAHKPIQ